MVDLLLKDEVYQIIAAAIEVHRELGSGFAEVVYQEAFQIELAARGIPFECQKVIRISYKGQWLEKSYMADVVCYGAVIVELKAIDELTGREQAQVLNYLKATGVRVGLLVNFGMAGKLDWQRLVR